MIRHNAIYIAYEQDIYMPEVQEQLITRTGRAAFDNRVGKYFGDTVEYVMKTPTVQGGFDCLLGSAQEESA